jgi:hypothetical protein
MTLRSHGEERHETHHHHHHHVDDWIHSLGIFFPSTDMRNGSMNIIMIYGNTVSWKFVLQEEQQSIQ